MEANLKNQATVAMLRIVSLASSPVDLIKDALRNVLYMDSVIAFQELPHDALDLLASTHSLTLAYREVSELVMSVEAAIIIVDRWLEPRASGLQGLPAASWRVRADELVGAVAHASCMLVSAGTYCYRASAVLKVSSERWRTFPTDLRKTWMKDARSSLTSVRDRLIDALCALSQMSAAATEARDAANILIDFL
ncbi:hypothetical protein CFC21_069840 [Triticum aestivum]|uniref:Uncharacterized protein n=2 Tax=Triticum aestivum TaxID=4565 RepID=A0A9R1HC87_WHEAT|nr:uncharacterized protein LOC123115587 [Triticum aestivum]KAF7063312.1 hypothetical protein CFC21_069840 [Triticum aestivum]